MDYQFLEYVPEFKTQIAELRGRTFGGDTSFNTKYFEWKYEQNPYLVEPSFYVVLCGGQVVATRGFYGNQWHAGHKGKALIIPTSGDLAVDVDHRRSGLGYRMQVFATEKMVEKGHPMLMNLSANNASRKLQMRSGYQRVARYNTFQRGSLPRQGAMRSLASRAYRRLKRTIGVNIARTPFRKFDAWAAQTKPPIVGSTQPRYAEMSALVSRSSEGSEIKLMRDETFYRWRLSNPAANYRFIYYESDDGDLNGFVILQQSRVSQRTTIIDWEFAEPSAWINVAAAAIESKLANIVLTSTHFSDYRKRALADLGFRMETPPDTVDIPAPGMLLHAPVSHSGAEAQLGGSRVFDADSWDIRMIASDAF